MKIRVMVVADIGSFVAAGSDGNYYMLTLDDMREIDPGDVLQGTFDGNGDSCYPVQNVTRNEEVRICLEEFECSLEGAVDSLLSLYKPGATMTINGQSRIAHADDVARQICNDVIAASG